MPDQVALEEQGAVHNAKNWSRYLVNDEINIGVRRYIEELSGTASSDPERKLRRGHVFQAFDQHCEKGVVASILWGYPKGVRPGGKTFVEAFKAVASLRAVIDLLRKGPVSAIEACGTMAIVAGVGPSTYTKMLHFAGVQCVEGRCLIYDQMVMRSLPLSHYPEFARLRQRLGGRERIKGYSPSLQVATYGEFLTQASLIAGRLGVAPAQIEHELFSAAPRGRATPFA